MDAEVSNFFASRLEAEGSVAALMACVAVASASKPTMPARSRLIADEAALVRSVAPVCGYSTTQEEPEFPWPGLRRCPSNRRGLDHCRDWEGRV
jgi:hypothetical protein